MEPLPLINSFSFVCYLTLCLTYADVSCICSYRSSRKSSRNARCSSASPSPLSSTFSASHIIPSMLIRSVYDCKNINQYFLCNFHWLNRYNVNFVVNLSFNKEMSVLRLTIVMVTVAYVYFIGSEIRSLKTMCPTSSLSK